MIIIPSILTLLNLFAGVLSMLLFHAGYSISLSCIFIFTALLFDALDGYTARLLKQESRLGVIIDSFADFVTFGVAPAFLLHYALLNTHSRIEVAVVLLFPLCCAFRLVQFSKLQFQNIHPRFFRGFPAPAAGGLLVSFIFFGIAPHEHVEFYLAILLLLSFLMVCTIAFPKPQFIPWPAFILFAVVPGVVYLVTHRLNAIPLAVFSTYLVIGLGIAVVHTRPAAFSDGISARKHN